MEKVHVLGASGAVGKFLLPRLLSTGCVVQAYTRRPPPAGGIGIERLNWQPLDLWKDHPPGDATTIVSAGPLDGLLHWLGGAETPDLKRLIAVGSMSITAKAGSADADERAVAQRLECAEQGLRALCQERGIALTLLRATLIWGGGQDRSLNTLFRFGRRWHLAPIPMRGGGLRQPIHADDVAAACVQALQSSASEGHTLMIGGSERLSNSVMWSRVIRAARARAIPLPGWLLRILSRLLGRRGIHLRASLGRWQVDQVADNESAMQLLHWRPRGFSPSADDFR